MVLCTEDSSTMISEAVWARLPVIGVSPEQHSFKDEEREYRRMLEGNNWCRFVPIAELSVERFGAAFGEIQPLKDNPLDELADRLRAALPGLFAP
jgi:mitochondrial fission protein ELM1